MTITIEATYENGVLKPSQPLPLNEHEKVRVGKPRHEGGQDVVVAELYLFDRDRVVLVDDRYRAEPEEGEKGIAAV